MSRERASNLIFRLHFGRSKSERGKRKIVKKNRVLQFIDRQRSATRPQRGSQQKRFLTKMHGSSARSFYGPPLPTDV